MANLKIKKVDLKGPVAVGHGWLSTRGWAVRVGDDKRLVDLATLNAGFAGLDSSELPPTIAKRLDRLAVQGIMDQGYERTMVLVEDEDGALTRAYRRKADGHVVCFNETFLTILGGPPVLSQHGHVWVCMAGVIAPTTAECPEWAWEMA
jgi:hypothetical protein